MQHKRHQDRSVLMLQFSRKFEYALTTLSVLWQQTRESDDSTQQSSPLLSARQLAERTHISYDMCTKCLQQLQRSGCCNAIQGKRGGYRLAIDCEQMSVAELLRKLGEPVQLADCLDSSESNCQLVSDCMIRSPIASLNRDLEAVLEQRSLAQLFAASSLN